MDQIREERRAAELRAACEKNPEAFIAQTEWLIRLMKMFMVSLTIVGLALVILIVGLLLGFILPRGLLVAIWLGFMAYRLNRGVWSALSARFIPWEPIVLTPQTMPRLLDTVQDAAAKMGVPLPPIVGLSSLHEVMLKSNRDHVLHGTFTNLLSVGYPSLASMGEPEIRAHVAFQLAYSGNGFAARNRRANLEARSFERVLDDQDFLQIGNFLWVNQILEALYRLLDARVAAASAEEVRQAAELWSKVVDPVTMGEAMVAHSVLPPTRTKLALDAIGPRGSESNQEVPSHYARMETLARSDVSREILDSLKLELFDVHRGEWLALPSKAAGKAWVVPAQFLDDAAIQSLATKLGRPLARSAFDVWATQDLRFQLASLESKIHEEELSALAELEDDREWVNTQILRYSQNIHGEPVGRILAGRHAYSCFNSPEHEVFLPLAELLHQRYPDEPRVALWCGVLRAQANASDLSGIELLKENYRKVQHPWSLYAGREALRAQVLAGQTGHLQEQTIAFFRNEEAISEAVNEVRDSLGKLPVEPGVVAPGEMELMKAALRTQKVFRAAYLVSYRSRRHPDQLVRVLFLDPLKQSFFPSSVSQEEQSWIEQLWYALPPRTFFFTLKGNWGISRRIRNRGSKIWTIDDR